MAVGDGLSVDGWARDGCRVCNEECAKKKRKRREGEQVAKKSGAARDR